MTKILKALVFSISIFLSSNIFGSYGASCTNLPSNISYTDLQNNTLYGFVQNKIEATNASIIPAAQGCSVYNNTFTICVANETKQAANQSPACDMITFNLNEQKTIFTAASFTSAVPNSLIALKLKAEIVSSRLCLTMDTTTGIIPVICKSTSTNGVSDTSPLVQNCKIARSCYDPSEDKSKTLLGFSGKTILCVKSSLDQIFYSSEMCVNQDSAETLIDTSSVIMTINPYASFQIAMRQSVMMALVIYLIFFGMQMWTEPDEMNLNKYAMAVIKVVLVLYFSVGFGNLIFIGAVGENFNDGMTKLILPLLLSLSNSLTDIVFKAAGSQGLCYFNPDSYERGYKFFALWDSIDCRLLYYFGGSIITLIADIVNNFQLNVINNYSALDADHIQSIVENVASSASSVTTTTNGGITSFSFAGKTYNVGAASTAIINNGVTTTVNNIISGTQKCIIDGNYAFMIDSAYPGSANVVNVVASGTNKVAIFSGNPNGFLLNTANNTSRILPAFQNGSTLIAMDNTNNISYAIDTAGNGARTIAAVVSNSKKYYIDGASSYIYSGGQQYVAGNLINGLDTYVVDGMNTLVVTVGQSSSRTLSNILEGGNTIIIDPLRDGLRLVANTSQYEFKKVVAGVVSAYNVTADIAQAGYQKVSDFLSDTSKTMSFFTVFIPILLGGGLTLVVSMIAFGIMFFGLALNLLSVSIVCLIALYFMVYLAPIFVPMVLFERTKGYFDAWWKLLLSFAIRPVVIAGFVALTVTIFDSTFYGNCRFKTYEWDLGALGAVNIYQPESPSFEPEKCTRSIGMRLKDIYAGNGIWTLNLYIIQLHIWTDTADFIFDMVKMCIVGYLMYYFMGNVEGLATQLSGSQVGIGSMVIQANAFIKAGAKVFGKGMKAVGRVNARAYKGAAKGASRLTVGTAKLTARVGKGAAKGAAGIGKKVGSAFSKGK
jgi:type IV secretory pathway VirB6-like protein